VFSKTIKQNKTKKKEEKKKENRWDCFAFINTFVTHEYVTKIFNQ
jgi:hypothetical protein